MPASTIASPAAATRAGFFSFKGTLHRQLASEELVQDALRRGEGVLNNTGALVIRTGTFTGRSPKDKFIVADELTDGTVHWNDFNQPMEPGYFDVILDRMTEYLHTTSDLWTRDCYACADPRYRLNLRVITETPSLNLFACNMFLQPTPAELRRFSPEWTLVAAPGLKLDPTACGTRQQNAAVISFTRKMILIAGTGYTGEIKKAVFSVLNYLLPKEHGVLSMHCAANQGDSGDVALFFGLSGTGKTTLSADRNRRLVGDDEHGWSDTNIFNFEGGCYAKTIDLKEEKEPAIFRAIREGALVENTPFHPRSNVIDFSSRSITENTRVSYPLSSIENAVQPSMAGIPANIFFLTCDAYGVLPPVSRLTTEQAMYHFISGYTAKIAGTETGITAPVATFSACFGAPFLPLHPGTYAAMLGEKLRRHKVKVWLINTGWSGGAYGTGRRIPLEFTRAMISAALAGKLDRLNTDRHPVFGMEIPTSCPGVPTELLYPRDTWADKEAYDQMAKLLASRFAANFARYAPAVGEHIRQAGPLLS